MADALQVLMKRGSCRSFADQDISQEMLEKVLDAGIQAPTGGNLQPYSIITIRDQATKDKLTALCGDQKFISAAPVDLLFCIDMHRLERWARLAVAPFTAAASFRHFWIAILDTAICAQNICTAADGLGLGSVYVGTVLECFGELRKMFRLPRGVFPVVLLSLGWPKKKPLLSPRLPRDLVVHQEQYRQPDDQQLLAGYNKKYGGRQFPSSKDNLERLEKVSTGAHGSGFARRCLQKVEEQGYISMAQRYFGLHYTADTMPLGNREFLAILAEAGLTWMEEFSRERQ